MPRYFEQKTSFSSGQVSPDLIGRSGIKAHNEGMLELKNVYIKPSGAIQRRHGTEYLVSTMSPSRLISFSMGGTRGIIAITLEGLEIMEENGVVMKYGISNLNEYIVANFSIAYNGSRIYIASSAMPISYLEFNPMYTATADLDKRWVFGYLAYDNDQYRAFEPTRKAPKGATLTFTDTKTLEPTDKVPIYKVTSTEPFFINAHSKSNTFIYYKNEYSLEIYDVIDAYNANVLFRGDHKGKTTITDGEWEYSAFSHAYGYPSVIGFHQGRLVLAGNFESFSTLWFSKSGNITSFDYGTGLDDEAIDIDIADGQRNVIQSVISSDKLIIFASNGVWAINGSPITPTNTSYTLLTSIPTFSKVQPLQMENSFIFVGGDSDIYQLTPSIDGLFDATNLSYLCGDLIKNPKDMCYDYAHSLLQVVNDDGTLAVMSYYKDSETVAWSTWETAGKYYGITRINDTLYYCIIRSMANLEIAVDGLNVDSMCTPFTQNDKQPYKQLYMQNMLTRCKKEGIKIYEVDFQHNSLGEYNIDDFQSDTTVNRLMYYNKYLGLSYDVSIKPLPVSGAVAGASVQGGRLRVVSVTFRLQNTTHLTIQKDNNKTYKVPLNYLEKNPYTQNVEYSGDVKVTVLGWKKGSYKPSWHIKITEPTNFCLISVNTNIMASA